MLIPVLISLLALALLAGFVLLVMAYRRKTPVHSGNMMNAIDDEKNFDEGSWNVQRGGPPPEDASCDYHNDDMYTNDNASSIDPPDSFDGRETKPNATDFSDSKIQTSRTTAMERIVPELIKSKHLLGRKSRRQP